MCVRVFVSTLYSAVSGFRGQKYRGVILFVRYGKSGFYNVNICFSKLNQILTINTVFGGL